MTRIEAARRNLRIARYTIAIGAAAALAAFAAAARQSHPATRSSATVAPAAQQPVVVETDDGASYSIGPSGSAAPQIQSGGS